MSELRGGRELALKLLFQVDVGGLPVEEVLDIAREELDPSPVDWGYAEDRVRRVTEHVETLDGQLRPFLEGWRLERLAKVDRILLRLALYDLVEMGQPPGQVIDDIVEIAKKFSTEDSGRFINGVLGNILRSRAVPPRGSAGPPETELEPRPTATPGTDHPPGEPK